MSLIHIDPDNNVHCHACEYDHFTFRLTIQYIPGVYGTYEASATLNCASCGRAVPGIHIDFQLTSEV